MLRKADEPFICMFPCGGIGPPCICIGGCDPFPKEETNKNIISTKVLKTEATSTREREKMGKTVIYLDASLEHVEVADFPFDTQVPWLDSSWFAEVGSA